MESHPQHELYKRQMKGFGGMISVYLKGGLEEASVFMKSLHVKFESFLELQNLVFNICYL